MERWRRKRRERRESEISFEEAMEKESAICKFLGFFFSSSPISASLACE